MRPPIPELSGRARRDLDEIRDWTVEHWGRAKWQAYYRGLGAALRRIATEPNCGRSRSDLATGMRALVYERHLIFFAPVASFGSQPVILRIVHQARDLAALAYNDERRG